MIYKGVEYREIPGLAGYFVSNNGSVISTKSGVPVLRKNVIKPSGHLDIKLWENGCGIMKKVHDLVLSAWVRPKRVGEECRHLNGNPSDNRVENIKWGTRSENMKDGYRRLGERTPVYGSRMTGSKLTESQVSDIRKKYVPHKYGAYKLAKEYGVCSTLIQKIVSKKGWPHVD